MKLRFIIDKSYEKRLFKKRRDKNDLDELYKRSSAVLIKTKRLYQEAWNKLNDEFSDYVEKVTGRDWFYKTYQCAVSVRVPGEANWGNAPKIMRWWRENPYWARANTAYELIISHYFEIHKRHYGNSRLTDGQIWALAEIAALALTSLTPEAEKFWPWDIGYHTCHNYPHILDLQKKLKTIFLKRKSFDEYIKRGIALVKKYPKMSPNGA